MSLVIANGLFSWRRYPTLWLYKNSICPIYDIYSPNYASTKLVLSFLVMAKYSIVENMHNLIILHHKNIIRNMYIAIFMVYNYRQKLRYTIDIWFQNYPLKFKLINAKKWHLIFISASDVCLYSVRSKQT